MTIGNAIATVRRERGLSQRRVADLLNVDSSELRRWELGLRTPTFANLERVAEAMNVKAWEILKVAEAA